MDARASHSAAPRSAFARRSRLVKRTLAFFALLACVVTLTDEASAAPGAGVSAQVPPTTPSDYRVSVLTMGPGAAFVTKFGHDALLVERAGLPSLVYNFGMYTEAAIAPHHVLGGTLRYFLDVMRLGRTLAIYSAEQREVVEQVLDLEPEQAKKLALALSVNSQPENATYAYDFSRDNCTTRVRDALDRALGGALRRALDGNARLTLRAHALRFTADDWPFYFLFDLGLGPSADRTLSAWDDAFLPERLMADLRAVRVDGPAGPRPLVQREMVLIRATRSPVPATPPVRAPWHALAGFGLAGSLVLAGRREGRTARVAFGGVVACLGLVVGLLGIWLLLLLGTHVHAATHGNYNVLVCPPLALLLVEPALRVALGNAGRLPRLVRYTGITALLSGIGILLATVAGQESWRVALLLTPPFIGAWLGARAALRRA